MKLKLIGMLSSLFLSNLIIPFTMRNENESRVNYISLLVFKYLEVEIAITWPAA